MHWQLSYEIAWQYPIGILAPEVTTKLSDLAVWEVCLRLIEPRRECIPRDVRGMLLRRWVSFRMRSGGICT